MPRPRQPPHAVYRRDRKCWCIVDGGERLPIEPRLTSPGPADKAAAELAAARYRVERADQAAAAAPAAARPAARVTVEEVLDLYVAKRTDPDPKVRVYEVARPEEYRQRARALEPLWRLAVTDLGEKRLRSWATELGSPSYARRCLADLQSALNEGQQEPLYHETLRIWLPEPSTPREDAISAAEVVALLRVCVSQRDVQRNRVGGKFVKGEDGRKTLVGGTMVEVRGTRRVWAHVAKFLIVALATCSRSSRIYEASYLPEAGRPWVDLDKGVFHRMWRGERKTKKRAPTIPLPPRLVDAMRRWASDRVVGGREVKGDRYVVQWQGRPADPKGAWSEAVEAARVKYPALFLRDDGSPKQVVRHTLRHTGVTMLADDPDLTIEEVCAYAGMTKQMFERVYGHSEKSMAAKVAKAAGRKRKPKVDD